MIDFDSFHSRQRFRNAFGDFKIHLSDLLTLLLHSSALTGTGGGSNFHVINLYTKADTLASHWREYMHCVLLWLWLKWLFFHANLSLPDVCRKAHKFFLHTVGVKDMEEECFFSLLQLFQLNKTFFFVFHSTPLPVPWLFTSYSMTVMPMDVWFARVVDLNL